MQIPTRHSDLRRFAPRSRVGRLLACAAALLPVCLAVTGCSPPHLYSTSAGFSRTATITVQATGPEATAAVTWWNSLAGRAIFELTAGTAQITIHTDTAFCGPITTERVACTEALPASGAFADPPTYAYNSCEVFVSPVGAAYWQVYAHELGHCLGFQHVTDRDSIMNPHPIANDGWDRSMLTAAGYR